MQLCQNIKVDTLGFMMDIFLLLKTESNKTLFIAIGDGAHLNSIMDII